jgi:DnaJ-class molecular chaperone
MVVREKPLAVCPECHTSITKDGNVRRIMEPCGRKIDGRRCKGVFTTAMGPNDWKLCPACFGDGIANDKKCQMCVGSGWIYQRDRLGYPA